MSFYSDFPARRAVQLTGDIIAAVVVVTAIAAGFAVRSLIWAFGEAWTRLEEAGTGFEGSMGEIGESLGGVPLIGDGIRGLFGGAAGAGESLAEAGRTGRAIIETLANLAGFGTAALPVAVVLLVWLWPRLRFARRSAALRALLTLDDGMSLLALRALGSADAAQLRAVSSTPVRDWGAGEPRVVHGLAALAAREAGVRLRDIERAPAQRS